MSDHARLAPSGAYRWATGGCAAAPSFPDTEETDAAREGTAAHWVLSEILSGRAVAAGDTPLIDQDMVDNALDVKRRLAGRNLRVEERVTITSVHRDCFGTPDLVEIDTTTRKLEVWDYKYGHRYVDVFENPQLMLYAIGAMECNGIEDYKGWTITLNIIQPRCYHPEGSWRSWSLSGDALEGWRDRFMAAAILATEPNPPAKTGEHCRNCPGLLHCPASLQAGMSAIDVSYWARPVDLDPGQAGVLLYWLREAQNRIKMMVDATEEEVLEAIRRGTSVPLWNAEPSRGRERWTKPNEEVFALGDLLGVNLRKAPDPITPNQARKAGIDPAVIAGYSEKPQGSLTLVPVTEKSIRRAFQ